MVFVIFSSSLRGIRRALAKADKPGTQVHATITPGFRPALRATGMTNVGFWPRAEVPHRSRVGYFSPVAAGLASAEDVAAFIAQQARLVAPLEAVAMLRLPDCWIAAGFIRNAVWDALHGAPSEVNLGDVDVIYFDAEHITEETDDAIEAVLRDAMPGLDWSVKNQARMHLKNNDAPYANSSDAMMHWPEICTAVAARSNEGRIELLAPFGVDDLMSLRVRPTPAFGAKLEIYRERLASKRWGERWPRLQISFV